MNRVPSTVSKCTKIGFRLNLQSRSLRNAAARRSYSSHSEPRGKFDSKSLLFPLAFGASLWYCFHDKINISVTTPRSINEKPSEPVENSEPEAPSEEEEAAAETTVQEMKDIVNHVSEVSESAAHDAEVGHPAEEAAPAVPNEDKELEEAEEAKPSEMPEKSSSGETQEAAYNPETGEINWDCPCLGGMAHGPCGEEFKAAFSCFVYSEAEPKGVDCIEKFKGMQDCFRKYPEVYAEELRDEEVPIGEEAEAAEKQEDQKSEVEPEKQEETS